MSDFSFDATQVAPATGTPEPLPVGRYPLAVEVAEKKIGENGWGVNCNMQHINADAVRIGHEQFSALCHATGVLKPQALSELQNQPFLADVAIKKRKDTGEPQNVINRYLTIQGEKLGGGAVAGGISPLPAAKPVAASAPAWAAKKAS